MNRDFIRSRSGHDINLAYYEHFIGSHSNTMWAELKEKFNLTEEVPILIEMEKAAKKDALGRGDLHAMPGVVQFIETLNHVGIKAAVASSGRRDNVHLILEKIGLKSKFKAIVCGEDVARGKPAPDIFLKAASLCDQEPADAIVIEDSHNGALAAKAAGMRLVGFLNPNSGKQDLSFADLCIDSFHDSQLKALIGL